MDDFVLCVFVVVLLILATRGWSEPPPYILKRTKNNNVFFQVSFLFVQELKHKLSETILT